MKIEQINRSVKHDTIIQEKDQQIQVLNDLKQKQQNEMEDFLKVSYQTRWKNAAEEFEKNVYLQDKIESLTRTNEKLNSKLDSLTELVSEETQTDCNEEKVVTIKTKKGAIYILQNGQLLKDNKLVEKSLLMNNQKYYICYIIQWKKNYARTITPVCY